jgi:filamentous hemagglutinin family protein
VILRTRVFGIIWATLTATCGVGAQIVHDGTLGKAGSVAGPNAIIQPSSGRLAGGNLFHSFSRFDIPAGESATFTGPPNVRNVLARVTGGARSQIDGTLGCDIAGANLYLINRAGVVFGPDASLAVQGSFAVTTADAIRFSDGATFGARPGAGDAVLSSAAPVAFGFLGAGAPVTIQALGNGLGLRVPTGNVLSIVSGPIDVNGGRLGARGGRINLVATAGAGEVGLDPADAGPAPPSAATIPLADITVVGPAGRLDVDEGGNLFVRGRDLSFDAALINAPSKQSGGGVVNLAAGGALRFAHTTNVDLHIEGPADASDMIMAAAQVTFEENSGVNANTMQGSFGRGADIRINCERLDLRAGGYVREEAKGVGDCGDIVVRATDTVRMDATGSPEPTNLKVETNRPLELGAGGLGGSVTVDARALEIFNEAEISTTTTNAQPGGQIRVAVDRLLIDGHGSSGAFLTGLEARAGKTSPPGTPGGNIFVTAGDVRLINGGVISATTFGQGTGGNVDVTAATLTLVGSPALPFTGVFARSESDEHPQTAGNGGDIRLVARDQILISDHAAITSQSRDAGRAGSVLVSADGSVVLDAGGAISARAARGNAGDVTVRAGEAIELLDLRPGITPPAEAVNQPTEPANTRITAEAVNGSGGNVTLQARRRVYVLNSLLTARAGGNGAQITIDPDVVVLNHSVIDGRSGGTPVEVIVVSENYLKSTDSQILSTAVTTPVETDIASALARLPAGLLGENARLAAQCGLRLGGRSSSFIVTGRGTLAPEPGEPEQRNGSR